MRNADNQPELAAKRRWTLPSSRALAFLKCTVRSEQVAHHRNAAVVQEARDVCPQRVAVLLDEAVDAVNDVTSVVVDSKLIVLELAVRQRLLLRARVKVLVS